MKGISQYKVNGRIGLAGRMLFSAATALPMLLLFASAASPAQAVGGNERGTVSIAADAGQSPMGGVINYTITVHNGGQAGMYTLTDNLPQNTTLLSAPFGCTEQNGRVSCDLALFQNDVVMVQLSVLVDDDARCGAVLRNTARVRSWPSATVETEVTCP